ncbi:MAG: N-acetyl-anhydromuramyl-L-alanine amidase AmpD [Candidatus Midichloria mitochondrii]|uniref:N-acetylmuramoyl-L-alanine amidase n=1 Tax=Midichloria mitochondrii (strain IricVA) TaxID=696127 RepID=F7XWX1_MIDMI|nr:N-acetylmuramoyl-L-alanine amidase [Candidatus Midichloria mitochondrii]AEI89170.1 N-acetylmuramoyl-L-alanine amidase [Candidatus Midichloria mitochondrii IricVA]MDJ1256061.1 N-acetylmuramoyl-L-alanine amidase [Candidatus Midichloria mitochondrii]MDJ1287759.1 N-acetylmuramoyl-L-alanine amidase [Candidatus Midichloria mitochondrii]MDJ1298727.1 N-acetylmuramoyl-L-alanine amidase [Candidatus Midichloria mitochondrii]MDJ1312609.1 N-acetylmuramoyl-L-alanine amidase [Candidatus Midichloria mitoch
MHTFDFLKRIVPDFAKNLDLDWQMFHVPSLNFSEKSASELKKYIILHHTETTQEQDCNFHSLYLLTNSDRPDGVSSHYLILRAEESVKYKYIAGIINLVGDGKKAWHAGSSEWADDINLNDLSIGIEINNNGFTEAFSNAQMASLIVLLHGLKKAYDISPFNLLGHAEIAPNRKSDPSHHFNWKLLADYGLGYFPLKRGTDEILCKEEDNNETVRAVQNDLLMWGYRYLKADGIFDEGMKSIVESFQRRYAPDEYINSALKGCWTSNSQVIINELLKAKEDYANCKLKIEIDTEKIKKYNPLRAYFSPYKDILVAMGMDYLINIEKN